MPCNCASSERMRLTAIHLKLSRRISICCCCTTLNEISNWDSLLKCKNGHRHVRQLASSIIFQVALLTWCRGISCIALSASIRFHVNWSQNYCRITASSFPSSDLSWPTGFPNQNSPILSVSFSIPCLPFVVNESLWINAVTCGRSWPVALARS